MLKEKRIETIICLSACQVIPGMNGEIIHMGAIEIYTQEDSRFTVPFDKGKDLKLGDKIKIDLWMR